MTQEYPISNVKGITISNFGYAYNPVGTQYALTYDAADQLVVNSNAYAYDLMGNRLAETTQSGTNVGRFNILNQLTAYTSSSITQTVSGHTSSPITSGSIDTVPVTVSNGTNFTVNVPLSTATNVITVQAQNSAGTSVEQKVQTVTSIGASPVALSYDLNGNAAEDEYGNTYSWDALNRLIKIAYLMGATSNFGYDGASRRISIVEKNSSRTVTSTKLYLWLGGSIIDERNSINAVQKRFYPQGEQQSGTDYFYTRDHLGSVRELISSSGTIISRLSYDVYGKTTVISGTTLSTFQYAGYYDHATSGLYLTQYRAFDSITGHWLSRDPISERGGINLYDYCGNEPIGCIDPFGRDIWVEGSVPGEPSGHQRLAVGNPNGTYTAYDFGLDPSQLGHYDDGTVAYDDPLDNPGGIIMPTMYAKTSAATDIAINNYLRSLIGQHARYGAFSNCRTFAQGGYTSIVNALGANATPSTPPPTPGRPVNNGLDWRTSSAARGSTYLSRRSVSTTTSVTTEATTTTSAAP